jgi:hypothetical protein
MNSFQSLLNPRMPVVFNPKVTPDPTESERLEAKLNAAMQQLRERLEKGLIRRSRRMPLQA